MAKTRRRNNKVRRTKSRRGGVPHSRLDLSNPVAAALHAKLRKSKPMNPEDDPLTTRWTVEPGQNGPVYTKHIQRPQYGIKKNISNYARAQKGLPLHDPIRFKYHP